MYDYADSAYLETCGHLVSSLRLSCGPLWPEILSSFCCQSIISIVEGSAVSCNQGHTRKHFLETQPCCMRCMRLPHAMSVVLSCASAFGGCSIKLGFHRRLRQSFDVSSGCCSFEAIFSSMQLAGASVLAVVPVALMT